MEILQNPIRPDLLDAALYEAKDAGRDSRAGFERRIDEPMEFEGSLDIEALVARGALVRKRFSN